MIPEAPPDDLKRPSESEQESCDGKKPRTEDPLVAANALACFAGPGSEDGSKVSDTTDAAPSNENEQPVRQDEAPKGSVHYDDDDTETTVSCASDSVVVATAAVVGTASVEAAAGMERRRPCLALKSFVAASGEAGAGGGIPAD